MASKDTPIAIVGAGAFGLSTAWHLLQSGYTNITVFDKDTEVPSRFSAANDLNKIVRAEYEDRFYTDLTIEAISAWKSNPLFAPHFHQTGFLHCVTGAAPEKAVGTLHRFRTSAENHPEIQPHVVPLENDDSIRKRFWQFNGQFPTWHGYLNQLDGYAHSANALAAVYRATRAAGVRFFLGDQNGAVQQITYADSPHKKANGVRTVNGRFHPAGLVIVAVGAAAGRLVPKIGKQVVAKSWSVAHVHLTDEETSLLRGIPVTYARDLGFLFEPDPKSNLLKLCPMGGGYIDTDPQTGVSYPPLSPETSAFLPQEDEKRIRKLLAQTLPALSERPLVRKTLCWFADTSDSDFIIDYVPETSSSLVLLSGDSGHGFKMFPIFGKWVVDLLQNPDNQQAVRRWRWKGRDGNDRNTNWGGDVSWRVGETRELSEVQSRISKL
ncbi:FAD dependent oxidoreductase [Aspergillus ambiguus]|uniref:NAD(P)/FAD-dependent oxidoreductase n=1 Tax=Aspergillus ambiguus TaxID=176160 RepID=UPI003CCDA2C3